MPTTQQGVVDSDYTSITQYDTCLDINTNILLHILINIFTTLDIISKNKRERTYRNRHAKTDKKTDMEGNIQTNKQKLEWNANSMILIHLEGFCPILFTTQFHQN